MNINKRYNSGWSGKELDEPRVHEVDEYKKFPATYTVQILRKGNEFKVYTGDHLVRTFTTDTLPNEIKSAIAMIHAVGWGEVSESMDNVGWFDGLDEPDADTSKYRVVVTAGLLDRLKGKVT